MIERRLLGLGPHGFHKLVYRDWGRFDDPVPLVCVHGLARSSHDFDFLARALATERRVVCPDMAGRGQSDWLADPDDYDFPLYVADMTALIARLDVEQVDWLGTSMGGLIGLGIAAQPGNPIRRLIINDIGPFVPKEGLQRIRGYLGKAPVFPNREVAEASLRKAMVSFGIRDEAHWQHIFEHDLKAIEGGFTLRYDPGIAENFNKGEAVDVDLWAQWDAVRCPVLVVHGAESDILTGEVVAEMRRRKPDVTVVEFADVGHAPMLMEDEQVAAVRHWLDATEEMK